MFQLKQTYILNRTYLRFHHLVQLCLIVQGGGAVLLCDWLVQRGALSDWLTGTGPL